MLTCAALLAAVTGLVGLLAPHVPSLLGLPTLYLLAVVPVAIRWGSGAGTAMAVAGWSVFTLGFMPWYAGFRFEAPALISLGVLLVSALAVGWLAARARRKIVDLARLSREQAVLGRVATLVAESVPKSEVFAAVIREVGQLAGADLARLERYEEDDTVSTVRPGAGYRSAGRSGHSCRSTEAVRTRRTNRDDTPAGYPLPTS